MNADSYIAGVRKTNAKLYNGNSNGKSPVIKITLAEFEKHVRMAFMAGELSGHHSKSEWEKTFGHKANEAFGKRSLMEMIFG